MKRNDLILIGIFVTIVISLFGIKIYQEVQPKPYVVAKPMDDGFHLRLNEGSLTLQELKNEMVSGIAKGIEIVLEDRIPNLDLINTATRSDASYQFGRVLDCLDYLKKYHGSSDLDCQDLIAELWLVEAAKYNVRQIKVFAWTLEYLQKPFK